MRASILFLFLGLAGLLSAEQTVCLNMIVKNESHVIERGLESVKDRIDYWVIVDTGSTDGTQEIIRNTLKEIPGELHERPWVNFGHNRTEALQLAKGTGDYLLFLDADDEFIFPDTFEWPELSQDVYSIRWVHGGCSYIKPQLVRSTLPWEWKGVLHEYLTCHQPVTRETISEVIYQYNGNGIRSQDPEKYKKSAAILKAALEEEPGNRRYHFYYAESLRDAGELEKAIAQYERRAAMGGWQEEVYWSLLQAAILKQRLGKPDSGVIQAFEQARAYRPHRPEAVYYLARLHNKQQKPGLAYAYIKAWEATARPPKEDILFHMHWIERYAMKMELSLAAYYCGRRAEFVALCDEILAVEDLPENFRRAAEENRKFASTFYSKFTMYNSLINPISDHDLRELEGELRHYPDCHHF